MYIESGEFDQILAETKARGFGERELDYWVENIEPGPRLRAIAVPIMQDDRIFGCLNLVSIDKVASIDAIVADYLSPLKRSADRIAQAIIAKPALSRAIEFSNRTQAK